MPVKKRKEVVKRGVGRPTKYRSEMCQELIEHMAIGYSFESFAAISGVTERTLYEWTKEPTDESPNPFYIEEFSQAKKRAFALSRKFWEGAALEGLFQNPKGKQLNTTLWIFNMKNRFGWKDRVEQTTNLNAEVKGEFIGFKGLDKDNL